MIIPKIFLEAIVSISDDYNNIIGTGFICLKREDEKGGWLYLVTNKHVLKDRSMVKLKFQNKNSDKTTNVDLPLYKSNSSKLDYSIHPKPEVDIAVMHINGKFLQENNMETGFFEIDKMDFNVNEMRENGVGEGNLVYSLGYPLGFANVDSKYPICRLGCIARMSEKQIRDTSDILIDIQNFPGSSGSPVILRPEIISVGNTKSTKAIRLIGILHSYIPYEESLISSQTKKVVEIRQENSGLANMHPVDFIREVIEIEFINKNKEKFKEIEIKVENETRD